MTRAISQSVLTLSRRGFTVAALGAGFALAAQPVCAQTMIHTDAAGLTVGDVRVPGPDGPIPAYRAYPAGRPHAPVVLVVHEIFGVHEHIKDLCRRLAHRGYYAIAPDLFARYGDATQVADIQTLLNTIVKKTTDAQMNSDLDAAVRFAAGEKADASRLAITGFCFGGAVVWKYAAHNPAVKAAAAWYGPLAGRPGDAAPTVLSVADKIHGRVIGFYGGKDPSIPPVVVDQMRAALKAAGDAQTQIVVYPDAGHAFNADYRPSYVAADARDAWGRMLDWFKVHGVA